MKKPYFWRNLAVTACISIVAVACNSNATQNTQSTPSENNTQQQSSSNSPINYGELIIKEQSDYVMIPVYKEKEGGFLSERPSYKRAEIINNLIFYHKANGETNLLLKKAALIDSYQLLETKNAGKPNIRLWFYGIIDQDSNEDKKLNQEDAIIGYISDLAGKNLQQVTPNNTRMLNWVVLPSQNVLLIRILKDSNNDKKFTSEDAVNFVRVSLEKPEIGQEIINDQLEQEIKSYLQK